MVFSRLRIARYRYDLFLRPLTIRNQIKVLLRKFSVEIFRRSSPQALEIGLTYHCQLNCRHCGVVGQAKVNEAELTTRETKNIIMQASQLGVTFIIFAGAEPLLRNDLQECIEYAIERGMMVGLSTNGELLTPDQARRFKNLRVSFVNISLDSAEAFLHDRYRGKTGCYESAVKAIGNCLREKLSVIISTCATKENVHNGDLKNIIRFAKDRGAQGVRILPSVPSGRWLDCPQVALSEQDMHELLKLLDPRYVYIEGVCNKLTECNAVAKKLFYVSPYGEVQPCSFVPVYFGNIRKEPLVKIWSRMRKHGFFSRFDGADCMMRDRQFPRNLIDEIKRNKAGPVLLE